jgi:hypothetical protein
MKFMPCETSLVEVLLSSYIGHYNMVGGRFFGMGGAVTQFTVGP